MKLYFTIPLTLFALLLFTSCEESFISPNQDNTEFAAKGGKKGKKLPPPEEPTPEEPTPTEFSGATYQLTTSIIDPLVEFTIDQDQQLILLRATEEFGTWGIDYFGYWSDPFSFADQQVYYKIGLTETTYLFEFLSTTTVQVTKNLIVRSEFTNEITQDETTNVGTFELLN
jgi:hypothetical protein